MYISGTDISCGVLQLYDVGMNPCKEQYERAMSENDLGCFIIASVPRSWNNAIKFLKSVGFKPTGRVQCNPNSGNKIMLLAKSITEKERAHFRGIGNRDW